MVLEKLGGSLKDSLRKITKAMFVDEKVIDELNRDIQRALLEGDADVQLVLDLTQRIRKRSLADRIDKKGNERARIVNIVYEELVNFLGEEKKGIVIEKKKPFKIMLIGLFGSGKTTSVGKIGRYYAKRGFKVAILGLDVHRPAAMDQLEQVAKRADISCFVDKKEKNPIKIYEKFLNEYKRYDVLLIDTAGRDALSDDLVKELELLDNKIKPDKKLLVLSADIGQATKKQAEQFHKSCSVTGIIITKLDGTAKGGGALTGAAVTGSPIQFIGVGEDVSDLEEFNPKGFVSRLLGMGDLESLLEKAKDVISEDDAKNLQEKVLKGDFTLLDLYEQMQAMKKMGPLNKIAEMIPGMGQLKLPKGMLDVQEGKLDTWGHLLKSMTKKELEYPESVLDSSRLQRISKGSGVKVSDVRELIKQYRQAKKLMKMMQGNPEKMMKKFKLPKGIGM